MRHVANAPLHFTEELVGLLMTAAFFLALPLVTLRAEHVRVTIVIANLPDRIARWVGVCAGLFGAAFCLWYFALCVPWLEFAFNRNLKTEVAPPADVSVDGANSAVADPERCRLCAQGHHRPAGQDRCINEFRERDRYLPEHSMTAFWALLVGGLTAFAGSGLALGAALGLTGFLILKFTAGGATFVAVDAVWNVLNSFTLSAIPLFIILGEIMLRSGVSERIYTA